MKEARHFEQQQRGRWRLRAYREHPSTGRTITETWGYFDEEEEAERERQDRLDGGTSIPFDELKVEKVD
jgi:hypothetical protein